MIPGRSRRRTELRRPSESGNGAKTCPESAKFISTDRFTSVEGQDSKRAEEEFRSAARKLPNSVVALRALADLEKSRGEWGKRCGIHVAQPSSIDEIQTQLWNWRSLWRAAQISGS